MLSFKCKNCGGEMSVSDDGGLVCDYCGSKVYLTDSTLTDYKTFRLMMLNYLKTSHDDIKADAHDESGLWNYAEEASFTLDDNTTLTAKYIHITEIDDVRIYLTKHALLYSFKGSVKARHLLDNLSHIHFPAADVRNLKYSFSELIGEYRTKGGDIILAFKREKNYFPLSLFGALAPEHAAWILSRLENICCVMEYSFFAHGHINIDAILINPFTHQALLMGNWWDAYSSKPAQDLKDIRKTAEKIMGIYKNNSPKLFKEFIQSQPEISAYEDFAKWDKVIESPEGFGGRRFSVMKTNTIL